MFLKGSKNFGAKNFLSCEPIIMSNQNHEQSSKVDFGFQAVEYFSAIISHYRYIEF